MIPEATTYTTDRGIRVLRTVEDVPVEGAIDGVVDALDSRRGALFASSYEYPGRYTRWDMGFVDPPLELVSRDRAFRITALNARGRVLLPAIERAIGGIEAVERLETTEDGLSGE